MSKSDADVNDFKQKIEKSQSEDNDQPTEKEQHVQTSKNAIDPLWIGKGIQFEYWLTIFQALSIFRNYYFMI